MTASAPPPQRRRSARDAPPRRLDRKNALILTALVLSGALSDGVASDDTASSSNGAPSDRNLASRRRERKRRLGIHRHLERGPRVPIHRRAGERGDKAVDYGPRPTTTGGRRATAQETTVDGVDGTTAAEKPADAPAGAGPFEASSPHGGRSLQSDDPDGVGGTFGPWWYEPDWSFDSYISSLGHPAEWKYPVPEDYQYDPQGTIFPEWFDWTEYRPIRIAARYIDLPGGETAKNDFLMNTVIPGAVQFWTKALMVYPARRLYVNPDNCQMASPEEWTNGVTNVDLQLYVRAEENCGDGSFAAAGSCDWDQFDKPIGGIVEFCYDKLELDAETGAASPRNMRLAIETAIHELAHVLGFDSGDMAYYYDRTTGEPRTARPISMSTVECVTPGEEELVDRPAESTLKAGSAPKSGRYFELVTPTVAQAARNHFNCDSVQGIRLENQPTAGDCFGDHLEERLLWNDILSAIATTPSVPEYLSPILLALFEDTGWYRSNYDMSRVVPFGHGAGCPFLDEPCLDAAGEVPQGNEEYFCDTQDVNVYHCDPSHTAVANCDLKDFDTYAGGQIVVPDEMRLFGLDANLGGKTIRSDFCPVFGDFVFTCRKPLPDVLSKMAIFDEETYSPSARCYDSSDYNRPFCLETVCNAELRKIQVVINGETINCDAAGQQVPLPSTSGSTFTCPPLATMCPDLVCRANCAGRGVCLWDEDPPRCDCLDGSGGGSDACFSYRVGYPEDAPPLPPPSNPVDETCTPCPGGEAVPDPAAAVSLPEIGTCDELELAAQNVKFEEEACMLFRLTGVDECGCERGPVPDGKCRVCGDGNVVSEPTKVLEQMGGRTCGFLELVASFMDESADDCSAYRSMAMTDCGCEIGEEPVPPPTSPPVEDRQDGGGGSPVVEDFYGCRAWCADLPVPWKSDDPADTPKCTWWTYACSGCPQCQEAEL